MKFYVSSAFLEASEIVEIARAADELGYEGMAIPDHVVNLETLATPYPYTEDGERRPPQLQAPHLRRSAGWREGARRWRSTRPPGR